MVDKQCNIGSRLKLTVWVDKQFNDGDKCEF